MRFLSVILIAILTIGAGATENSHNESADVSSPVINIERSLLDGHRVRIAIHSVGAFHNSTDIVDLNGQIAAVAGATNVKLSRQDLAQISRYFDLVRASGNRGSCTAIDAFEISVWSAQRLLASESLRDSDCVAVAHAFRLSKGENLAAIMPPQVVANVARFKKSESSANAPTHP